MKEPGVLWEEEQISDHHIYLVDILDVSLYQSIRGQT